MIRNNRGLVIASCSLVLHQEFNSNKIEAMAATKALSFAAELGLSDAVLEGDSMVIIKALEEEHNPLSPLQMQSLILVFLLIYFTLIQRENVIRLLMV